MRPLIGSVQTNEIANGWMRREEAATKEVERRLKQAGFDHEAITAQTFGMKLATFERIERMIMQAEARRAVILREIDRHRSVVAQRLREIASEVEDAEFREIADGEVGRDAVEARSRQSRQCEAEHGPQNSRRQIESRRKCASTWSVGSSQFGGEPRADGRRIRLGHRGGRSGRDAVR